MNDRTNEQAEERTCAYLLRSGPFAGRVCGLVRRAPVHRTAAGDVGELLRSVAGNHDFTPAPSEEPKPCPKCGAGGGKHLDYGVKDHCPELDTAEPKDAVQDERCGKPVTGIVGCFLPKGHDEGPNAEPCQIGSYVPTTPPVKDEGFDAWMLRLGAAVNASDMTPDDKLQVMTMLMNARRSTAPLDIQKAAERIALLYWPNVPFGLTREQMRDHIADELSALMEGK